MKKFTLLSGLSALLLLTFTQCNKDIDTYYERPDWLEAPIYQILEADGDFSLYLEAVDRTLHKQMLQGAGLYTCFAPNNTAFKQWMNENGFKSVAEIPQERVDALVSYSLVYNLFKEQNLGASLVSKIWTPGMAYKYKTTYSPMLSQEESNGETLWTFDENTPGSYSYSSKSVISGNYKYLPIYTDAYFKHVTPALTAEDYESFYPGSTWAGRNVGPATILSLSAKDTTCQRLAENGVVYEIDKVVEPIDNMYDVLTERSEEFSEFMSILNYKNSVGAYYYKKYMEVEGLAEALQLIYPDKDLSKVSVRSYTGLNFSPISEVFKLDNKDATQENANTLFLPTNEAMREYFDRVILKYYNSVAEVPMEAMTVFLNSQVSQSLVWPSTFKTAQNSQTEYVNGSGKNGKNLEEFGVKEKIMTSNGIIYVTDSVVKSRYFETVYAEIFLNPIYDWLNIAYSNYFETGIRNDLMKSELTGYASESNTLLLFSDDLLRADGMSYDAISNAFSHSVVDGPLRLQRLIRNHVFLGYKDNEASGMQGADLTFDVINSQGETFNKPLSQYNSWMYRVNNAGELIRFKEGKMQGIGDVEEGTYATVTPVAEYPNGHVMKVDRLLKYSRVETGVADTAYNDRPLWEYLDQARKENPNVSQFVDYIEAFMKNSDNSLTGVKSSNYYTVLMPTNTAINKAKAAGLLPQQPMFDEQDLGGANKAMRFIQAHFLVGRVVADDNLPIIYPADAFADDLTKYTMPSLLSITNEALGLTNAKAMVTVYKKALSSSSIQLYAYPLDITSGGEIKVKAYPEEDPYNERAYRNHVAVTRGKLTNPSDMCRSNRMAGKAVLHEVNNYLYFVDQN